MGDEAAGLQVLLAVEAPALALEVLEQLLQALAPVTGAEHQEEVVAADMADEIAHRIDPLAQTLRQAEQHFVAAGVTVDVVEGLEAVDVDVADHRLALLLQQPRQALLDRHVAGQQGQRVGVAGLLDLLFGDQLEHVDHPAEATILAVLGDDEILLDALPGAAGEQPADLLQRLAQVDAEEVVAHQPADRLAREQVGGEGFEQGVGKRMAMHDADRMARAVEHRQRIQVGLQAERFEHLGDGGFLGHRLLFDEQRGERFLLVAHRRHAQARHQRTGVTRGVLLRPFEQVALDQVDAHFGQYAELFDQFDAFGDHLRARHLGHLQDRLDEFALHRIPMDAVDEVAVDLHVVRAQLGPQAQAGITGAEVVQGDREAHRAVVMQGVVQQLVIVDRRLLGQLDHHLARRDAEALQQLERASGLVRRLEQRLGRYVEEQLALELQVAKTLAGGPARELLKFAEAAGVAGHGEQRQRRMQRAVGRPAAERFVAEDAPLGKADDRLEQAVQVALSEDQAQRAGLLGDGHRRSRKRRNEKGRLHAGPFISRHSYDRRVTGGQSFFATVVCRPR